jgi:predicted AlkP superfamily pyrophosphatase or phosphodiesterase
MTHRPLVIVALASMALAAAPIGAQGPRPRPAAGAPTLVVFFTVDQMRPDYFTLWEKQLTGGLARLRRGAFFTNAFQDHAITETAPGHASTMSGRFPYSTGIVANTVGVNDPQSPLIGTTGDAASPFRFRGTVLADWMRYADPQTRALSVSRKDRGAILPLGRVKQNVFWYAPANGTFTTSTYYADTLPTWVRQFNARRLPQQWAGKQWDLLLDASQYQEPDSVPFESGGQAFTFPHAFPADPARTAASFAAFPMMDELTLRFALEGMRQLSLGDTPGRTDLLAISLSTTDAIGHRFGPDSREQHDQILRLDRYLGVFLDSLFAMRDSTRIVMALTADHAVTPLPEMPSRYANKEAGRVDLGPVVGDYLRRLLAAGLDSTGFDFGDDILYLEPGAVARANLKIDSLARDFARRVSEVAGVQRVDVVSELASRDTTQDDVARRWLHMLPPDLPAAAVVTFKPFWYSEGVAFTTHGTPHYEDAHVPVLLWGAGVRPGTYDEFARVVDLAPTLAELVGVRPMERVDGRVLRSAIRR